MKGIMDACLAEAPTPMPKKVDRLPFFARLLREPPFLSADELELEQAANCVAVPTDWYATAPRYPDTSGRSYRFATSNEAEAMQRSTSRA